MDAFFSKITGANKQVLSKPARANMVNYCELDEWYGENSFRSFGIKYVIDNYIYYRTGKREHLLKAGDFMLAGEKPHVQSYFDRGKTTRDLCINISKETVREAFTVIQAREHYRFDDYLARYFNDPVFFETVCPAKTAPALNKKLLQLVENINAGTAHNLVNKEWFLDLVEKMVYHEYGNHLALNGLRSVKTETKKEILQRLNVARTYMDDCFLEINDIAEVAAVCNLSEFHFFRSFRQAYAITPYQYLLQKRLEFAKTLLVAKTAVSLNAIATQCNFADLPTFSKAFKRQFGVPPSRFASVY